jgi:hypothetical protein
MIIESSLKVPPTLSLVLISLAKILKSRHSFITFNDGGCFAFSFSNLQIIGSFERIIHVVLLQFFLQEVVRDLGKGF